MPCNSDYMEASTREIELSRVSCLLDELNGKKWTKSSWEGYHPRIYCCSVGKDVAGALVAFLCARLQSVDVSKYSLEMQMWWRDHQQHDKERLEHEQSLAKTAEEKQKALSKLTPYERKLLGLEE